MNSLFVLSFIGAIISSQTLEAAKTPTLTKADITLQCNNAVASLQNSLQQAICSQNRALDALNSASNFVAYSKATSGYIASLVKLVSPNFSAIAQNILKLSNQYASTAQTRYLSVQTNYKNLKAKVGQIQSSYNLALKNSKLALNSNNLNVALNYAKGLTASAAGALNFVANVNGAFNLIQAAGNKISDDIKGVAKNTLSFSLQVTQAALKAGKFKFLTKC